VAGAFFIFDEQRLVGAGDWSRKFLRIAKHNNWILLTATPGDNWMDYIPVFVANGFYKNRTEYKRKHVVYNTFTKFPKVDRYIDQGVLFRHRNHILVEMPFERNTVRHPNPIEVDYDKEMLDRVLKDRWHVYADRPLRDIAELCAVARKVVNSHPSRLEMMRELWKKHPRLIIFYNFNYELEILRRLWSEIGAPTSTDAHSSISTTATPTLPSGSMSALGSPAGIERAGGVFHTPLSPSMSSFDSRNLETTTDLHGPKSCTKVAPSPISSGNKCKTSSTELWIPGRTSSSMHPSLPVSGTPLTSSGSSMQMAEWNGHKHQPVPTTDEWVYLVQYTAGAEGWNCTTTNATAFYSLNYSWKVWAQAHGRIDRLDTLFRDLYYYYLISQSWIDKAIQRSLKSKETFNERKYAGLMKK
jgi:hypothetical protein